MEFYELIEKIISAVPADYESVKIALENSLPWILGIFSAATCFFGHTVHKIWNYFFFFWIGFLVPVFVIGLIFDPSGGWMNALIVLGILCGGLCAFYSKKLFKLQLFVTSFLMVFISLPSYLSFIGETVANITGFAVAVVSGILSTKYKYMMTIATTAFSGSFMLFSVFEANLGLPRTAATVFAVIIGIIGLGVQCFVERKELKETIEEFKKKKDDLKKLKSNIKDNSEQLTSNK